MLDPNPLTHDIVNIMAAPGAAPAVARAWARAYANYGSNAISPLGGSPLSLEPSRATLETALVGIFSNPYQLPPQTASLMSLAFTAFWFLPPVVTTDTPPGIVTAVAGTALLQTALLSTWLGKFAARASAEQAAVGIAAALDAFTRTVIILIPIIPTPVIGPLS